MKRACYSQEEATQNAIQEMENCMAYLTLQDTRKATTCYGAATVWDEMLFGTFGVDLYDVDGHYHAMLDIWYEQSKNW